MTNYCTTVDRDSLLRGLTLHRSLLRHDSKAEVVMLCLDGAAADQLHHLAMPGVRGLPLDDLLARFPRLAPARADRTAAEFARTCKPWLMLHLLAGLPAGQALTFLDATLAFFHSPQALDGELGSASVALVPRHPAGTTGLSDQLGRYHAGWIRIRHDPTGLACLEDWAEKCRSWCFTRHDQGRYAEQKYLDDWPRVFPGTVIRTHPGALVTPLNLGGRAVTPGADGPLIDGQPLVAFDFSALTPLGDQLYDPGLHAQGLGLSAALRAHVYLPYVREWAALTPATGHEPDLVPPTQVGDPRCAAAVSHLLGELQAGEQQRSRLSLALAKQGEEARRAVEDGQAALHATRHYVHELEQARDAFRTSLLETKEKLKTAYADLNRNIAYLKRLEAEIAAHVILGEEKNSQIATLCAELNGPAVAANLFNPLQIRTILGSSGLRLRKLLVAKFHPRLLPHLLALSATGTQIEVFASPPDFATVPPGPLVFRQTSLWEWLGWIDSLFDEPAYLRAHPDVAAAVAGGSPASGWEHYLMFGQREGRASGTANYCSGLAEFEGIAFDDSDAAQVLPCLIGRVQPHHQLVLSGHTPDSVWLPADTTRSEPASGLLLCPRAPAAWLGPVQPANGLAPHLPALTRQELFPAAPATPGDAWPKITLITVSLNQAARLEETLRSVLEQNYPNLEYIVIDRGSTDETATVLRRQASRLAGWSCEPDLGLGPALNAGFREATGTILAWLNPGDRLAPGSLQAVAGTFLRNDTDLVAGRCAWRAEPGSSSRRIHRSILPLDRIVPLPLDDLIELDDRWLNGHALLQPSVFYWRASLDRVGHRVREDLTFCHDYDLWIRLAKAGASILAVPEILAVLSDPPRETAGEGAIPVLTELRAISAAHRATP